MTSFIYDRRIKHFKSLRNGSYKNKVAYKQFASSRSKVNFHFRIFISVVSTNGNRQNILPKINLTSTHSPVTNRPAFIQFPYIV